MLNNAFFFSFWVRVLIRRFLTLRTRTWTLPKYPNFSEPELKVQNISNILQTEEGNTVGIVLQVTAVIPTWKLKTRFLKLGEDIVC